MKTAFNSFMIAAERWAGTALVLVGLGLLIKAAVV